MGESSAQRCLYTGELAASSYGLAFPGARVRSRLSPSEQGQGPLPKRPTQRFLSPTHDGRGVNAVHLDVAPATCRKHGQLKH